MKAKNRLTAYLCSDADEVVKVPLSSIEKANNPHFPHIFLLDVMYFTQINT